MTLEEELRKYERFKGERISTLEKLGDALTGLDERQDYTNKLLMQMLIAQGVQPLLPGVEPTIMPPPSYPRVKTFALDTARAAPGELVQLPGNVIAAYTDGSYEGSFIRIENQGNDAIPLAEVNPYYHPGPFTQFYLETTAQTGKYLRLVVASRAFLSISDLSMHIETAQKVGLYLQPEWAALQALDKNFVTQGLDVSPEVAVYLDYAVPSGKNLYVCGYSTSITSNLVTDYDHHIRVRGHIRNYTDNILLVHMGGEGGSGLTFPKPVTIPGGKTMRINAQNFNNIDCDIFLSTWGYEI